MLRKEGRLDRELRPTVITKNVQEFAEGSVMISTGKTQVLCAVSVVEGVPRFLEGAGRGWVTAEYAMLPRATTSRNKREGRDGALKGRTQEIQRLIGRSLRAAVDTVGLGERTLTVDCDVIVADGGTRTASITGAYVAVNLALRNLVNQGILKELPITVAVASTSVGILDGMPLLDLDYDEDSAADVDFNVVMTNSGDLIEVQGTAEGRAFSREALDQVLDLAEMGITDLFQIQQEALSS